MVGTYFAGDTALPFRDLPSAANGEAQRCFPLKVRRKIKKPFISGVQVGYGVGLLLSTGLVSLISMMTTDEQFLSWGWHIPFLFSIVLVLGALWVRNGMEESAEFEQQQHNQAAAKKTHRLSKLCYDIPIAFLKIIALRLCELLTMYIVTAF